MFRLHWPSILAGLLLINFASSAAGGEYSDPSGYSFTYPDGWLLLTESPGEKVKAALPAQAKKWLTDSKIDLSKISAVLLRIDGFEILENMNVVVGDGEASLTESTLKKYLADLPKEWAGKGVTISNMQSKIQKIGSNEAIVIEYNPIFPHQNPIKQRQVILSGGGKTFFITCSAAEKSFDQYSPTFDTILASFNVPPSTVKGFDWGEILISGVVGGAIAGGAAVIGGLFKRRKKNGEDEKAEEADGSAV